MKAVDLGSQEEAFARGGNRLCFVHPDDPSRCIKVIAPERTPSIRRAEKSFPKNLKPLHNFDDNLEEHKVMQIIKQSIGEVAFELVPRCYGFVETNYGPGLVSDMIRDDNGLISITLKQYIWERGVTDTLQQALKKFVEKWHALGMPSRNLLLHNILVQQHLDSIERLVVIDGLGWADISPLAYRFRALARFKAARKVKTLYAAIEALLHKKSHQLNYGYHGWLTEEKRKSI